MPCGIFGLSLFKEPVVIEPENNALSENLPASVSLQGIPGPGGVVVDQYILLEKLSSSRTGLIFKAQHRLMGRIVAVRFLSEEAAASKMLAARFHRAIQILARLEHRNLVKAFEAGEQGGAHYLVMEYVDGQDLRSIIKEKKTPLGVEQSVRYTIQAAAGLGAAHQQGICHRNIKPGNLLVDSKGLIKIVGFTLAHVEAGGATSEAGVDDNLTRQGQMIGTYEYMSPEQAMDSSSVDRRADIYSLGCTLHMLLTGRPPYVTKPGMQQVLAHRMQPIPSLRQARPEVPEALDRVFQKMVAKAPDDRYASMEEVMTDLESSLTGSAPVAETTADNLRAMLGLSANSARPDAAEAVALKPKPREAKPAPRMVPIVVAGVLALAAFAFVVHYFQDNRIPQVAKSAASKTDVRPATRPSSSPTFGESQPSLPRKDTPPSSMLEPPSPDQTAVKDPVPPPKEEHPDPKPDPVPRPDPKPDPKPETKLEPKPAVPEKVSPKPLPVPDEAARQRASKLVSDMFQEEIENARTRAEKSALARKILRQANDLNDDPAGRYVMLETCRALAQEAVDTATAMEVVDAVSRDFIVDAWLIKANVLADLAKDAKNSVQHGALAQHASTLAQKAIEAGQFETATQLSELAVAESVKARDPKTRTQIRAAVKEIDKAVAMHRQYEDAKEKLRDEPRNPEANLAAGRYECLVVGNWKDGLQKLMAGSDETLRVLAAKDLAESDDPEQQAGIGDGWWELAKQESETISVPCYRRAAIWYKKASLHATGLLKNKIEKRLETIQGIAPAPASS